MTSGLPVAFALALVVANCSVYEPSLLSGAGAKGGGLVPARGGSAGKGGAAGAGGSTSGVGAANGSGGASGKGAAGAGGSAGRGGAGTGGDAGSFGDAGEGAGGDPGGGDAGDGGSSGSGSSGSGSGGTGGIGGSSDAGGISGAGGSAGSAGSSGGSATAGDGAGGRAGSGGSGEVCSGCARFSVPLTSATDQAHILMSLPENTDFTSAVVTFRVFCQAGSGGQLRGYLQHGGSPDFAFLVLGITELADLSGWTSVSYELSGVTGFDKTVVRRVELEITGAASSAWTNPTVVYLDSISIANTSLSPSSFGFDDAASITTTPSATGPLDQCLWMNDAPDDSNVDASLSWLGP